MYVCMVIMENERPSIGMFHFHQKQSLKTKMKDSGETTENLGQ